MNGRRITPAGAEIARDSGLHRASTLTKLIGVGAIAFAGVFAGLVAQAKPGRSTGKGVAASDQSGSSASAARTPDPGEGTPSSSAAGGSASLTPPSAPPAPAPAPAPTVSGGS